jgi:O-antigen ligase
MHILIILMFIAFFSSAYQVFAIGTYGFTYLDLFTTLLYLNFFKKIIWDGEQLKISYHSSLICLIGLLFAALISSISPLMSGSSEMMNQYFKTCFHFIYLGFFVFICAVYPFKTEVWVNAVKTWLLISLIINMFGVYQIIARVYDLPFAWLDATNVSLLGRKGKDIADFRQLSLRFENFYRMTSLFSEPSALGSFNNYVVIFVLIPYFQNKKRFLKSGLLTGFILAWALIGLFLAYSLTGLVTTLLIILGVIFFQRTKIKIKLLKIFAVSIFLIIITDSITYSIFNISVAKLFNERITGIVTGGKNESGMAGESFFGRAKSSVKSIELWAEYPLTGIGLGVTHLNKINDLEYNDYALLGALSEMGIIGLITFISLFVALFISTSKIVLSPNSYKILSEDNQRLLGTLFYILILQFVCNFISGNNLVSFMLWIVLGFIFGVINNTQIELNQDVYTFSVVKKPLKLYFSQNISKYNSMKKL